MEPVTQNEGMYGYKAFFRGRVWELYARSLWDAKQRAIKAFGVRPRNVGEVSIVLCERPNGSTVTHSTAEL